MNRSQRGLGTENLGALCAALLALWVTGCGVEVGNPSEPTPGTTKDASAESQTVPGLPDIPIDSVNPVEPSEPVKIDVRYLVENQYDEAITAALDFAFDNTTVSLALAGTDNRTCGTEADGSLVLSHQETNSETRSSGGDKDATQTTESFSRVFSLKMVSPGVTMACNSGLTKPKLDWSKLSTVNLEGTLERTNSRSIVSDPGKQLLRESTLRATGSHSSDVKKQKYDPNTGLQLSRSLQFATDMQINNKTMSAAPDLLNTHIETMVDGPMTIEESYNANSALKSLKIVSGAITAKKQDDGLLVIMRYENVVLDAAGTCKPTSGTILGEVYLPTDPTKVYEKFSIAFTAKDNLIVYADGTGSKLEFEPCRIEIEQSNTNNNNNNNNNPPSNSNPPPQGGGGRGSR